MDKAHALAPQAQAFSRLVEYLLWHLFRAGNYFCFARAPTILSSFRLSAETLVLSLSSPLIGEISSRFLSARSPRRRICFDIRTAKRVRRECAVIINFSQKLFGSCIQSRWWRKLQIRKTCWKVFNLAWAFFPVPLSLPLRAAKTFRKNHSCASCLIYSHIFPFYPITCYFAFVNNFVFALIWFEHIS